MTLRSRRPLLLLALATAAAGCGDSPPEAPREPVGLTLAAPPDGVTTREAGVRVSGSVAPVSARVLVGGRRVRVSGGRFATRVSLREGANVIDVGASAPGARATWRALRVVRRSRIELPDVLGLEIAPAVAKLEALGFDVRVSIDDGLLDALRRRPRVVCRSDPDARSLVKPRSTVELVVSKTC